MDCAIAGQRGPSFLGVPFGAWHGDWPRVALLCVMSSVSVLVQETFILGFDSLRPGKPSLRERHPEAVVGRHMAQLGDSSGTREPRW